MNSLNLVDTLARRLANDMSLDNTEWDGLPEHDDGSFIDCKDRYRECVRSMLATVRGELLSPEVVSEAARRSRANSVEFVPYSHVLTAARHLVAAAFGEEASDE